jgi:ankyrin repeat protein
MSKKVTAKRVNEFVAAAERGSVVEVSRELEAGLPVDSATKEGFWALYLAAERGHAEVVRVLLDAGADPNRVAFIDGRISTLPTALHTAVENVHCKVIDQLLNAGAIPRVLDDVKATCAHRLLKLSSKFLAQPNGAQLLESLLYKMLDKGVPVNQPQGTGIVLLGHAIGNEAPLSVQQGLIRRGTELRGSDGAKLLHYAVFNDRIESVRLLLESGVDVNGVNQDGQSALWKSKDVSMDRLLLDAGADVNQVDANGWSVLSHRLNEALVMDNVPPNIEILLSAGADVDLKPFRAALTSREFIEKNGFVVIAALVNARDARESMRRAARASAPSLRS